MDESKEGGMGHSAQLGADGFIDLRPVMAEEIHPEGRDAVEIAAPSVSMR